MKKILFKIAVKVLPHKYELIFRKLVLGYQLISSKNSYLVQSGYVNSRINLCLKDENNDYIPWMNYPFIDFLKKRLKSDFKVFEYGSGASTIFFAKRTQKVISVEYDKKWYNKIKDLLSNEVSNGIIHYQELNDSYPLAIEKYMKDETCDVIIIDGRMRVKCAKVALKYLSDRGVLIIDDTHRDYYTDAIKFYEGKGFKTITFKGIKPTGFDTVHTTFIYRDGNCFGV